MESVGSAVPVEVSKMGTEGSTVQVEVRLPVTNSRGRSESPCDLVCSYGGIQAPPGLVHDSFRISSSFPQAVYCLYFFLLSLCFFFPSTLCANISGWICYHLPDSWQFILYSAHSSRQKQTSRGKKNCSQKQYLYKQWGLRFFLAFLSFSEIANHDYQEDPLQQPPSVPAGLKLFWIRWVMAVCFH